MSKYLITGLPGSGKFWLSRGATPIDADLPVDQVADAIIREAGL
jgi:hypothetical protein